MVGNNPERGWTSVNEKKDQNKVRPASRSGKHYKVVIFSMGMDSLRLSITHGYVWGAQVLKNLTLPISFQSSGRALSGVGKLVFGDLESWPQSGQTFE